MKRTVKLNLSDLIFLQENFFKKKENNLKFNIRLEHELIEKIRDWAGEELQRSGFDKDYSLTKNGETLEQIIDKLYLNDDG